MERFNQTIQNMLVKFVNSKKESWEDYLDTCVYAYNSAKYESSKFSPFEVMFGRLDLDGARACEDEQLVMEDFNTAELERMMEETRARLEVVQANILAAQERQKEQYDRKPRRVPSRFTSAEERFHLQKVYRRKARPQMAWNLQKFRCPWQRPL